MIEWLDASFTGKLDEVRPNQMEVVVGGDVTKADVCNVIPAMKAGRIVDMAGIANKKGWAPVVPATMQSRMDPNIHVLGDASHQGDMPKSGFSANSQAKVASNAIRAALTGSKLFPARFPIPAGHLWRPMTVLRSEPPTRQRENCQGFWFRQQNG